MNKLVCVWTLTDWWLSEGQSASTAEFFCWMVPMQPHQTQTKWSQTLWTREVLWDLFSKWSRRWSTLRWLASATLHQPGWDIQKLHWSVLVVAIYASTVFFVLHWKMCFLIHFQSKTVESDNFHSVSRCSYKSLAKASYTAWTLAKTTQAQGGLVQISGYFSFSSW